MEAREVFLHKLADLQRRTDQRPPEHGEDPAYRLLMAAPLLREILLGAPPLVVLANREVRMRLSFRYRPMEPLATEGPRTERLFAMQSDLFFPNPKMPPMPDGNELANPVEGNLDQFLRAELVEVERRRITVRELIDYAANAAGGVHLDNKVVGKPHREALDAIAAEYTFMGSEGALVSLRAIGQVVVTGLTPLAERLVSGGAGLTSV